MYQSEMKACFSLLQELDLGAVFINICLSAHFLIAFPLGATE